MRPRWLGGRRFPAFDRAPVVPRWWLLASIACWCFAVLVLERQHRFHEDQGVELRARIAAAEARKAAASRDWCRKEYLACLAQAQKNSVKVTRVPKE